MKQFKAENKIYITRQVKQKHNGW